MTVHFDRSGGHFVWAIHKTPDRGYRNAYWLFDEHGTPIESHDLRGNAEICQEILFKWDIKTRLYRNVLMIGFVPCDHESMK